VGAIFKEQADYPSLLSYERRAVNTAKLQRLIHVHALTCGAVLHTFLAIRLKYPNPISQLTEILAMYA
jgi:hypothetical protein